MDEKTLSALTTLAQKLGTTAEYLWGVLLKQAPITGAIELVVMAAWIAAAVWWLRLVQRKTSKPTASTENKYPRAEWEAEGAVFAWGSVVICWLLVGLCVGPTLSSTAAALLNPEYWALKQILK